MPSYAEFKKRQLGDGDVVTFQGYKLDGEEIESQGRVLIPFVGCICVTEPCPCKDYIIWIDKDSILSIRPLNRKSADGVPLQTISVKPNIDIRIEAPTVVDSSTLPKLLSSGHGLQGSLDTDWQATNSLTIEDHTTLVSIAMEHFGPILSRTRALRGVALTRDIGATEILEAFATSSISNKRNREMAAHVLELCNKKNFDLVNPPEETREVLARLDEIFEEARDFDEILLQVQSLSLEYPEDSSLRTGLKTGVDMLEDGRDTIYSPSHPYYQNLAAIASEGIIVGADSGSGTTVVAKKGAVEGAKDIGKADVAGAVIGAVATPGAVAGGVTASFGKSVVNAVEAIIDWF